MFIATTLLFPAVLGLLCLGTGLLVDRLSGGFLPAALLPAVGAAGLIALSQLSTYAYPLAPATPWLMAAAALAGVAAGRARIVALAGALRARPWLLALPLLAYAIALAPVLAAGRPSFSSYRTLADSAVHMLGASFLLSKGQHYVHLDLRNSYGQYIEQYYGHSYPSGADTLYGGSSLLIGLPLIWTFQPFNAFMLALASGPAWRLARGMRLNAAWAMPAALTAVLPALVYAYELFGSVKEITALAMILTLGCLVMLHRCWLRDAGLRAALPVALTVGAGVSALGAAFGAWALATAAVLAGALVAGLLSEAERRRGATRAAVRLAVASLGIAALAALPTLADLSGSVTVAGNIASTQNNGNLEGGLRAIQVIGVWLHESYKSLPTGGARSLTYVLVGVVLLAALLGAVRLIRVRAFALIAWLALMLLVWAAVSGGVTAWAGAKTMMLTSPVVVLLAWGGVAALKEVRARAFGTVAAVLVAAALTGGVLASDLLQYRASDLAPTARYEELRSLDGRFAGKGPALLTDFDEYALYALRDLDIGGPDFTYGPPSLPDAAEGRGRPVQLDRVAPAALSFYPLIVTRRDPSLSRPPAAYDLRWQGRYYQVWARRPGAPVARAHVALRGSPAAQCRALAALAARPAARGREIAVASLPQLVHVEIRRGSAPVAWGREGEGRVMSTPGTLTARFTLPRAGRWDVWVKGAIMPAVRLGVDGRELGWIAGQLDGNSLVPDTVPPFTASLSAGAHRISVRRYGAGLGPGETGSAVLDAIFLTPAGAGEASVLRTVPAAGWEDLCGAGYEWAELIPAGSRGRAA